MTRQEIETLLQPGDTLLYRPKGFFGLLIALKTWHRVAHCELYVGEGRSTASRDGIGVGLYRWRDSELAYILRPTQPLDWAGFWKWFRSVNGQRYDWWGLLRFVWTGSVGADRNGKMFCSEYQVRAYRKLGAQVFGKLEDAGAVAPFAFLLSPNLTVIATPQSLASPHRHRY